MDNDKHANEPAAAYTVSADQIVSQPVILERGGKPVLVLVPYEEYQRLQRQDRDAQAREKTAPTRLRPQRNTLARLSACWRQTGLLLPMQRLKSGWMNIAWRNTLDACLA
jgi:PHD/YefM family antitoxin component YafN of YafNO toxin-antitoxin module